MSAEERPGPGPDEQPTQILPTGDSTTEPVPTQERTMEHTSLPSSISNDPPATGSRTSGTPTVDDTPWSAPPASAAGTTAPAPPPATREIATGVRVGTVVWGLVVVVVGILLAAAAAGVVFDVQLAVIVTVALAGLGLIVGSVVSAARRRAQD